MLSRYRKARVLSDVRGGISQMTEEFHGLFPNKKKKNPQSDISSLMYQKDKRQKKKTYHAQLQIIQLLFE